MKIDNPDDNNQGGGGFPPPSPYPIPDNNTVSNAWGATDSIVGRVLHYITNPWRFLVVIILGVLVWFALVSYQNIDYIKNVMQRRLDEPKLNLSEADRNINILMKSTNANAVLLYKIDPALNKKRILRAYDSNGRDKNVEGEEVGLFSTNKSNNEIVTQMMTNQIVCLSESEPVNSASLWFESKGSKFICMISLPPYDFQFIAQLTVGFSEQPSDIDRIKNILNITATELMLEN